MNRKHRHKLTLALLLCSAALVAGCDNKPKTFAEYHLRYMEESGNKNAELHDTMEVDGYVVALNSTAPDHERYFGVGIHEVLADGWKQVNGSACDGAWGAVGYKEILVLCGQLRDKLGGVTLVLVNEREARIADVDDARPWYAVSHSRKVHLKYVDDAKNIVYEQRIDME